MFCSTLPFVACWGSQHSFRDVGFEMGDSSTGVDVRRMVPAGSVSKTSRLHLWPLQTDV